MKIVTCATHDEGYFQALLQGLRDEGIVDVEVIGWGTKFVSLRQKLEQIIAFLRTQDPEEIVCIVDAFDMLYAGGGEAELLQKFRDTGKKLVFSAETEITRNAGSAMGRSIKNAIPSYKECLQAGKPFLNTGGIIGFAGKAASYLGAAMAEAKPGELCDQNIVSRHFVKQDDPEVGVDTDYDIFYCITHENPLYSFSLRATKRRGRDVAIRTRHHSLSGRRLHVHETDSQPAFIHFNGNLSADAFVEALDLPKFKPRRSALLLHSYFIQTLIAQMAGGVGSFLLTTEAAVFMIVALLALAPFLLFPSHKSARRRIRPRALTEH